MKKKILVTLSVIACALLLVVGSVVGTFAYLQSTASVKNTFTVGSIKITLDETDVDLYGVQDGTARKDGTTTPTNTYKLIPGHTYTKDPIIHVTQGSEQCYLFVKVANQLTALEVEADATSVEGETETVAEQMAALGWIQLSGDVWYYDTTADDEKQGTVVDARENAVDVTVFETFSLAGDAEITEDDASKTIEVNAYAVQADGFGTAQAAWDATFGA